MSYKGEQALKVIWGFVNYDFEYKSRKQFGKSLQKLETGQLCKANFGCSFLTTIYRESGSSVD